MLYITGNTFAFNYEYENISLQTTLAGLQHCWHYGELNQLVNSCIPAVSGKVKDQWCSAQPHLKFPSWGPQAYFEGLRKDLFLIEMQTYLWELLSVFLASEAVRSSGATKPGSDIWKEKTSNGSFYRYSHESCSKLYRNSLSWTFST